MSITFRPQTIPAPRFGHQRPSNATPLTLKLGPNSAFKGPLNGTFYQVNSTDSNTTLSMGQGREKVVFTNGRRVSGDAPDDYAEYRAQNAKVPVIVGPGWPEA